MRGHGAIFGKLQGDFSLYKEWEYMQFLLAMRKFKQQDYNKFPDLKHHFPFQIDQIDQLDGHLNFINWLKINSENTLKDHFFIK